MTWKALENAVLNNDKATVERLLHKNDWKRYRNKALVLAAQNGFDDMVVRLLKDDQMYQTAHFNQALVEATKGGYVNIVKLLLKDGRADPDANDSSALGYAIYGALWGRAGVIQIGDISPDDDYKKRSTEMVKLFIADGRASPAPDLHLILKMAGDDNLELARQVLNDPRSRLTEECFIDVIGNRTPKLLTLLLSKEDRWDSSIDWDELKLRAIRNDACDDLDILLKKPKPYSQLQNLDLLFAAFDTGAINCAEYLLKHTPDIPVHSVQYLWDLAINKYSLIHLLLQDKRMDPRINNNFPLKVASAKGCLLCMAALLADPRMKKAIDMTDMNATDAKRFALQLEELKTMNAHMLHGFDTVLQRAQRNLADKQLAAKVLSYLPESVVKRR